MNRLEAKDHEDLLNSTATSRERERERERMDANGREGERKTNFKTLSNMCSMDMGDYATMGPTMNSFSKQSSQEQLDAKKA